MFWEVHISFIFHQSSHPSPRKFQLPSQILIRACLFFSILTSCLLIMVMNAWSLLLTKDVKAMIISLFVALRMLEMPCSIPWQFYLKRFTIRKRSLNSGKFQKLSLFLRREMFINYVSSEIECMQGNAMTLAQGHEFEQYEALNFTVGPLSKFTM